MLKRMYAQWNHTTALCFFNKTNCESCSNSNVCEKYKDSSKNKYSIHPIKFATLMTYSKIGLKGITSYLKKED